MSEMSQAGVAGAVFVQCYSDCPEETDWVYSQVEAHPGVLGVVAGLDLVKHHKVNLPLSGILTETPRLTTDEGCHREVSEVATAQVRWCPPSHQF